MASKRVTYGDIDDLLKAEGFQQSVVPGSHVLFAHAASGASLLFPIRKANVPAVPAHVAMVKRTLLDFGFLKSDEFARWSEDPKHFQAA